jgi:alcohol dehydrogenase (cytochrome c)
VKTIFITIVIVMSCAGQVSYRRLLEADREAGNWMTYSGNYSSHRYSRLQEINRDNVSRLKLKWAFQMKTIEKVEATPLVVDGIMYVTQPPNDVFALDSETGRPYWHYRRSLPERINVCCGQVNRGLAMIGNRLFMGTVDSHLLALDRKTGSLIWDVEVVDYTKGYSLTAAPLAVKGKLIVGMAGGEYGVRGFLDAYDPATGKRLWRFCTIPGPGEPGNETWAGASWKTGGAPTWITGSFDPQLNLIYWGTGNPGPDWNGEVRLGDNLYSSCVIALDADSGKLKWHFQFTPHDTHDWDAVQIPVLVDADYRGRSRKLMYWGNRNAFFYVLDRETGEFLMAKPFATQTWAERIDKKGRPFPNPNTEPSREGALVAPGAQGATNWYSPSYSPATKLFYLSVWDFAAKFFIGEAPFQAGTHFFGGFTLRPRDDPGSGAIKAIDPSTGDIRWQYKLYSMPQTGLLSTVGNLVFGGLDEGQFFALDAESGRELWRANTGGIIAAGPISYLSKGKQLVSIAAGSAIFTFGLD